jgi:hypothetical protein
MFAINTKAWTAIEARNKKQWYELFSDKPELTDDGNPQQFSEWSERELFGSSVPYLASIDKVEDGGLTIYGRFHSDQWEDFRTFMRFRVENGKITKMEIGQIQSNSVANTTKERARASGARRTNQNTMYVNATIHTWR